MREETNKTDGPTETERQIIRMGISPKLSRSHCEITNRDGGWFLKDTSTNGTYVNDKRINSDSEYSLLIHICILFYALFIELEDHDKISTIKPEHLSQLPDDKLLVQFFFSTKQDDASSSSDSITAEVSTKVQTDASESSSTAPLVRTSTTSKLLSDLECPICSSVMYNCVSIVPCLHSTCSYCLSQCLQTGKSTCPKCRTSIDYIVRNHTLRSVIQKYLEEHPEQKRDDDEIAELNKDEVLTEDKVLFVSFHSLLLS